jgi:8-oxo-dGTP diphosphatase
MIDVTAAILIEAGAIFIARRQDDDLCGWEFPGGKIAPGETPESCLRRELQEEFAIDVTVGGFVGESVCCYGARTIRLLAYDCHHRVGIPECRVHTAYHWAPLSDLIGYDLLPADVPLAQLVLQRHLAEA